jgi:hypothetical protein
MDYPSQHGRYTCTSRIRLQQGIKSCRLHKSYIEIRNILLKHEIRYRKSKVTLLGDSTDPEYHLKKRELKN